LPSGVPFRRVARLAQVVRIEGVGVDDQRPVLDQVAKVDLQRCRVHGDEDVGRVARRADVVHAEVELESGNAGKRSRGRSDLGRKVRKGTDVVSDDRRRVGELGSRDLHAVARVSREADCDGLDLFDAALDWVPFECG
jgi:hypothetical protein